MTEIEVGLGTLGIMVVVGIAIYSAYNLGTTNGRWAAYCEQRDAEQVKRAQEKIKDEAVEEALFQLKREYDLE